MRRFLEDQVLILLSHTADYANHFCRAISFAELQSSQSAVDFVFRVLPNTAGVEEHCIGIFWTVCQPITFTTQSSDDQFAVQHIHLAANGFDVEQPVVGLAGSVVWLRHQILAGRNETNGAAANSDLRNWNGLRTARVPCTGRWPCRFSRGPRP